MRILIVVVLVVILSLGAILLRTAILFIKASVSGASVSVANIVGMRLRGNPPSLLIDSLIALRASDVDVSMGAVERVYTANKNDLRQLGGRQRRVEELSRLVREES
jgi:uncharacterized protein YqfA (UPF0365 family)